MSVNEALSLKRGASNLRVTLGIVGLVLAAFGALVLLYPVGSGAIALGILAVLVAVYSLVTGLAYLGNSLFSKTLRGWARVGNALLGLLYVVGAVVMAMNLKAAADVLVIFIAVIIGVLWITEGMVGLTTLGESPNTGWTIFFSIISIIAGITLVFSPLLGAVTLWWLTGISMLVLGIMQIIRAFTINPTKFSRIDKLREEHAAA